jgi:unsaturated rhamnogalacturonyl hydrolase
MVAGRSMAVSSPIRPATATALLLIGLAVGEVAHADDALTTAKRAFAWARLHTARKDSSCGWPRSTYMVGLWQYYAATVDAQIPDKYARGDIVEWGEYLHYQLCNVNSTGWTGPCAAAANYRSCADNQLPGATYIELYKAGLDLPNPHSQRTIRSITDELDLEIELGSVSEGSWPIVDLTYMAMAPLARLGAVTGDPKYFHKMFANWNASMMQPQRNATRSTHGSYGLFNFSDRLFMRDDRGLWHNGYWGRGQGWAMLGLVDAIRFGDGAAVSGGIADPYRAHYIEVFQRFAARLVELQGEDGAWRSSMLEADQFPTPDTTGTACFTQGLSFGVNAGLLAPSTFGPAARRAWAWLSRVALRPSGKVGFCQPAGAHPIEGNFSNSTSDFCVGMFLGAAAEVSRMAE